MKIMFLVPNPIGTIPGQRFRFEHYLPYLLENKVDYKVCPFVSRNFHRILYKKGNIFKKLIYTLAGFCYRIINIFQAFKFDLIFIYRETAPFGPPIFECILRLLKKPIIYDFDDAIYCPSSSDANKYISFLKFPEKTRQIIKLSKIVLVGNKNLQHHALRFNKNTLVFPTVINTDLYKLKAEEKKEKVCLGWSGSITTINHLSILKDVLKEVYAKYNVKIKVIGSKEFSIPGVSISKQEWRLDSELEDLKEIDIGVMPLPDNEWGRGKCGLKALQYMALGIATLCSSVGVNKEIIEDGINGFLCSNEDEWVRKISLLINEPRLRQEMGIKGRKIVEERYSVKVYAPRFLEILQRVYKESC